MDLCQIYDPFGLDLDLSLGLAYPYTEQFWFIVVFNDREQELVSLQCRIG